MLLLAAGALFLSALIAVFCALLIRASIFLTCTILFPLAAAGM